MGKQSGRKKKQAGETSSDGSPKQSKIGENSPTGHDNDTAVFISLSQELKEEGNKMFQKRDPEGAMLKYEKALKLLPRNHIDVSYLHSNMAACYMQIGLSEYPRAIHECNLALEVTPRYSKALLKRARCYEALNRLDLALRDIGTVLSIEPNNLMALEIAERVKQALEKKGLKVNDTVIELPPDYVEPPCALPEPKVVKVKTRKKKSKKVEENNAKDVTEEKVAAEKVEEKMDVTDKKVAEVKAEEKKDVTEEKMAKERVDDKKAEVKVVVEEKISSVKEEVPMKTVKLVLGEDIRWAQLPANCSLLQLREVVRDRFPSLQAVLIKYRDQEGDLVTITTNEELRWAEAAVELQGSVRLYIVEVNPEQDPFFEKLYVEEVQKLSIKPGYIAQNGDVVKNKELKVSSCIEDWIIQFAQLLKNHVGFESDTYLDLHEVGVKLYSEAMEEAVTSEEAQDLFNIAGEKFQEMAALALFNWGNVHMSRARNRMHFTEDASKESILVQIKAAYDWAEKEYITAGRRYEEALKIKPDFYEGFLALGQQQFELAKLSWYYAISCNVDLKTCSSTEVLQIYNNAEDNMEKGMQIWEELEEQRRSELSKPKNAKTQLQKMGLDGLFRDISPDEAVEQAANIRSQINVLWGTMLYERSIVEFKLGLPVWCDCLEVAVEKFELAGASPTDIAVMVKNHCSNDTAIEGLGFRIDEIVQAWNEMYEAKRWQNEVPSFRLEPLFRRRVSKIYHALEHA
ncbi:Tetratricopeptide repeat protein 1 [Morella rubra]|uniref:Tetratricopeptide repeat protein 1 n=1 Tax=Morella rubra TaxID=262757 RepID=A0A6A1V810_9ROSI|nr:Tetratricopeptide repeat protein 1 [Morella rubra]KAB1208954.1 Tetratricopeptide repeat protein 1 [Morella rubra]